LRIDLLLVELKLGLRLRLRKVKLNKSILGDRLKVKIKELVLAAGNKMEILEVGRLIREMLSNSSSENSYS
jgi:hypothetical protein